MSIAGFGFRNTATLASLQDALARTGAQDVSALAAPDDKCAASCLTELAATLGLPVLPVTADALKRAKTATQSPRSQAERGTGSVAEAAALAAIGPNAKLLGQRQISSDRRATCAIAIGPTP